LRPSFGKPGIFYTFGAADKGNLCAQLIPVVSPALNSFRGVEVAEFLLEVLASRLTEDLPSVRLLTISTINLLNRSCSPGVKSGVVRLNFCSNYWHLVDEAYKTSFFDFIWYSKKPSSHTLLR
jgi:hypothetical protein